MKNRIVALLAVLALLASMTACGGKTEAASSTQTVSEKQEVQSTAPVKESAVDAEIQTASELESVSESASDAQEAAKPIVYELPLTEEPVSFSLYTTSAPPFMSPYIGTDGSYNTAQSTALCMKQAIMLRDLYPSSMDLEEQA